MSHLLTKEDHELTRAEIDAGARGDALAALNFYEAGLHVASEVGAPEMESNICSKPS
jgi:hypothetical protein